jgi:hypothetical protein
MKATSPISRSRSSSSLLIVKAMMNKARAALWLIAAVGVAAGCRPAPRGSGTAGRSGSAPIATRAAPERPKSDAARSGPPRGAAEQVPGRPGDALDPCAERLHALCGPLLLYYLQHRSLPPTLQDLEDGPEPTPPLYCPDSRKPYVYLPNNAIAIDNPRGHILVHDPVAAHHGVRWAIVISAGATPAEPLIAKAVGIKEDRFAVLRSKAMAAERGE